MASVFSCLGCVHVAVFFLPSALHVMIMVKLVNTVLYMLLNIYRKHSVHTTYGLCWCRMQNLVLARCLVMDYEMHVGIVQLVPRMPW